MYRLSVAPTRAARYAVALSCNDAPLRELPAGCPPPSLLVVAAEPHALALRPVSPPPPPQPPSSASAHEPPAGLMPGAPWDEGWHLPPQLDEWAAAPGGLRLARAPAKAEAGVRCQLHVAMLDIFGNPCGAQGAAPSLRVVLDRPAEVP